MQSVGNFCIIPMQDYLGLDNSARMNQPSTLGKNWKWRLVPGQFSEKLQEYMKELALRYGRQERIPGTDRGVRVNFSMMDFQ